MYKHPNPCIDWDRWCEDHPDIEEEIDMNDLPEGEETVCTQHKIERAPELADLVHAYLLAKGNNLPSLPDAEKELEKFFPEWLKNPEEGDIVRESTSNEELKG